MGRKKAMEHAPIHHALTSLDERAERRPAIVNPTAMIGIGPGLAFHWPNLMLAALLRQST
jgi:hypothetical protein